MELEQLTGKSTLGIEALLQRGDAAEFANILATRSTSISPEEVLRDICIADNIEEKTKCDFAREVLNRYDAHGNEEPYPIFIAAETGQHQLLETLVTHRKHPAVLTVLTNHGETVILSVVRRVVKRKNYHADECSQDEETSALKSIKMLVANKCDIHARDDVSPGFTAIHLAAKNGLWKLVKFFLSEKVNIDIVIGKESTRELIVKHDCTLIGNNYEGSEETGEDPRKNLINTLRNRKFTVRTKENSFQEWMENNPEHDSLVLKPYKGGQTLLEEAVDKGLLEMARVLIEKGADPNPALFSALQAGEKFFDLLTKSEIPLNLSKKTKGEANQTVLHRAVLSEHPSVNVVDYILKESAKHNYFSELINARDYKSWTALHYAANRHLNEIVTILLGHNANLFTKDFFEQPAFFYLRPEVIEEHLNRQIQLTASQTEDNCGIIFDFTCLNIPREKCTTRKNRSRYKEGNDVYLAVEEEEEDKDKIFHREMEPLKMLADSPIHKQLLLHPLIRAFLLLKWQRLFWFYWLNFSVYLAFTAFFFLFVFSIDFKTIDVGNTTEHNSSNVLPRSEFLHEYQKTVRVALFALTIILGLREIWQFTNFKAKYIFKVENWLEVVVISLTIWLIFSPQNKALASILSLTITLEMVLLMSRHPRLATYVHMFLQVAQNFVKFLLWYMCLIIAFGFAFYIIFPYCHEGGDCKNFFNTIPTSIFKTVVMISGEYESGDIEFEHVSIASHLIFIAFLFFISMVMVNLLNGLAVSDTQQIKSNAELIFCKSQVKFFSDIESTILSNSAEGCCQSSFRPWAQWMSSKIVLLNNLLGKDNKITVYLYKNNEVVPDVRISCDCCLCFDWKRLPFGIRKLCSPYNKIVFDALQIVNRNDESSQMDQLLARMKRLEDIIENKLFAAHKNEF
ncbi:transient receptor potential channel pyrexia-like [Cloeon dipterum]|uniref:transient receptor potential channel pyrexia-like n=1 Tax=Cloeon dipterum TaxID=197152 RepID=UPI0032206CA5